jgi:GNAT superfamily N-acetyltransferase
MVAARLLRTCRAGGDATAQGRGIGGRLHNALLGWLPHRTALLSTHQSETQALCLYRKRGWVPLLEGFVFPGGDAPFLIMGLDIGRRAAEAVLAERS